MRFHYNHPEWSKLRIRALRRDSWTCKMCGQLCLGKNKNGHSPVVDHIKSVKAHPELAFELDNLRILCRPCDNKRHSEKGGGEDVPQVCADGFPENSQWR